MKYSLDMRTFGRMIILSVAIFSLAALSFARTPATVATGVNIVNNSSRAIVNVYLSHVGADDWGANQLSNGATIAPGQSTSLSIACDAQQVKVIGEDADGCFLSTVVSCGDNSTWTVTNDAARDCGGN